MTTFSWPPTARARTWLNSTKKSERESGQLAPLWFVHYQLKHWQQESDFLCICDEEDWAIVPPDYQLLFTQLWSDVTALPERLGKATMSTTTNTPLIARRGARNLA